MVVGAPAIGSSHLEQPEYRSTRRQARGRFVFSRGRRPRHIRPIDRTRLKLILDFYMIISPVLKNPRSQNLVILEQSVGELSILNQSFGWC